MCTSLGQISQVGIFVPLLKALVARLVVTCEQSNTISEQKLCYRRNIDVVVGLCAAS